MANQQTGANVTLQIHRTLPHPRETIFEAWTDATLMARWFSPSPDYTTVVDRLEARAGGEFRIQMVPPTGAPHVASGRYLEVTPPSRLRRSRRR